VKLCVYAVTRDNVIFALTQHGGHLGYFEGGIVLPNSVTWLDRIVVEFSNALLQCDTTARRPQQQYGICTPTTNSCANCEFSSKITNSDDDDDDDDVDEDNVIAAQWQKKQKVKASKSSKKSPKAKAERKFAADVVAEILRVSTSVVFDDNASPVAKALADHDNGTVKPMNVNHFVM